MHCNIVNNDYQNHSRVLYKLVLNKSFDQLLDISSKNLTFLTLKSPFLAQFVPSCFKNPSNINTIVKKAI